MGTDGQLRIVEVAEVGEDAILVHDAKRRRPEPGLQRWPACRPTITRRRRSACSARSIGPSTARGISQQVITAAEQRGPGDLGALLRSNGTWTVESDCPDPVDGRRRGRSAASGVKNVDFGGIESASLAVALDLGDGHGAHQHGRLAAAAGQRGQHATPTPCW